MKHYIWILCFLTSVNVFAYTIDDYIKKLSEANVTEIDDAIPLLPENVRSHFTLIHTGHGLRGTSYQEPAVIGFEPDGSFFVNVGSKNQNLGNQIEILQFNKSTKKIELFSLEFPLRRNAEGLIQKPQTNPPKCLSCHGSTPNGLWGKYGIWDGSYGSHTNHDYLLNQENFFLNQFKASTQNETPYRYFSFDEANPNSPFPIDKSYTFDLSVRPNSHGGMLISRINALKMGEQILVSPIFENKKFKILYELMCSDRKNERDNLLISMGFSAIDIKEMKSDGVTSSEIFIGIHLINNLKQTNENQKIRNLFKTITFYDDLTMGIRSHGPEYKQQLLSLSETKIRLYKQLDELLLLPKNNNQQLCKYLKRKNN